MSGRQAVMFWNKQSCTLQGSRMNTPGWKDLAERMGTSNVCGMKRTEFCTGTL